MDTDMRYALDDLVSDGSSEPQGRKVTLTLEFLKTRIPPHTRARAALLLVEENLGLYARDLFAYEPGVDPFEQVREAIEALRTAIQEDGLPQVRAVRTPQDWAEVARSLGVRADWHEPDEREVTVVVTGGSFDNAGFAVLEKMAVVYQRGVPVAEVNLATLMSWATRHGESVGRTAIEAAGA